MLLKTYQDFENGITKLDYARSKAVAEILGIDVEDLINVGDSGVYIAKIKSSAVTIHNPETKGERELFEKIIAPKDEQMTFLSKTNEMLQNLYKIIFSGLIALSIPQVRLFPFACNQVNVITKFSRLKDKKKK